MTPWTSLMESVPEVDLSTSLIRKILLEAGADPTLGEYVLKVGTSQKDVSTRYGLILMADVSLLRATGTQTKVLTSSTCEHCWT